MRTGSSYRCTTSDYLPYTLSAPESASADPSFGPSYTDRVRIAYYRQTRFNSERNTSTPRAADNITLRTGIHPISSSTRHSHVLNSGYYMQPIFTHTTYSQRAYFIKKCILGINTQTPGKVKCFYLRIPRVIELLNQEAQC